MTADKRSEIAKQAAENDGLKTACKNGFDFIQHTQVLPGRHHCVLSKSTSKSPQPLPGFTGGMRAQE